MRRTSICIAIIACACGDDGATNDDDDTTGADDSASGSPTSATLTSTTATTTVSTTTDADTTTTDVDTSTSDTGSTSESSGSESSSGEDTTTGGALEGCLPAEVFTALDQHMHDMDATAGLLAGHPSQGEVTGFLLAPGLPTPPAYPATFAGLFMPCMEPVLYDPYCESGGCSQIECTGSGAGWIEHVYLDEAFEDGDWTFAEVHIHLRWNDGATGTFIDLTTVSAGPDGIDMSMTADGLMDAEDFTVLETFPNMHEAGETALEYTHDDMGYSGTLTIAGVVAAEVDAAGHLVETGDCP